jgi:hypothetical protein
MKFIISCHGAAGNGKGKLVKEKNSWSSKL